MWRCVRGCVENIVVQRVCDDQHTPLSETLTPFTGQTDIIGVSFVGEQSPGRKTKTQVNILLYADPFRHNTYNKENHDMDTLLFTGNRTDTSLITKVNGGQRFLWWPMVTWRWNGGSCRCLTQKYRSEVCVPVCSQLLCIRKASKLRR